MSFVDCVLNIRPSIELCCLVVLDLSCNGLFRFFFFVLFVFLLLLPLMANKVVCDRPYATFYWSAIVNIALSCTIFEFFDVE